MEWRTASRSAAQSSRSHQVRRGRDQICATGGVLSKGDDPNASQYTLEEMKAIGADAHGSAGAWLRNAHGAEGVRWASEAGVDSIEHGHLMTTRDCHPEEKRNVSRADALPRRIHGKEHGPQRRAGVFEAKVRDVIAAMRKNVGKAFCRRREKWRSARMRRYIRMDSTRVSFTFT